MGGRRSKQSAEPISSDETALVAVTVFGAGGGAGESSPKAASSASSAGLVADKLPVATLVQSPLLSVFPTTYWYWPDWPGTGA
jgi:hypothetical protein